MQWGSQLDYLNMMKESGFDVPALNSRPEIDASIHPLIEAFNHLSTSRSSNGYGLNPISILEIKSYIELGLSPYEPRLFISLIQAMDNAFLEEYSEKQRNV